MEYLDLSGKNFQRSRIPKFLSSLKHLSYLDLSRAGFDGMIPHRLGNLTNLKVLDLRGINFYSSGGLYADNFQWVSSLLSLQRLDMSDVNLTKALDVMQVLNTLPSLLHLSLDYCYMQNIHFPRGSLNTTFLVTVNFLSFAGNMFSGKIPNVLQNMTALRVFDLSGTSFNSSVPLWLGNSKNLVYLSLGFNCFDNVEGGLLSMLNKMCTLKSLSLDMNQFHSDVVLGKNENTSRCLSYDLEFLSLAHNEIGGHIPNWFGQLKGLKYLHISFNSFSGPIPSSLKDLLILRELEFSGNQLNGTIPQWLGRLSSLESLSLQQNQLSGTIPQSLQGLSILRQLDLSGNKLSGTIPQSLGRISTLEQLDLSNNQLKGHIPQSLGRLSMLRRLGLSLNLLTGTIPQSLRRLSSLEELDLSHNQLNGSIPQSFGRVSTLKELDISYNQLGGSIPDSIGQLVNLERLDVSCNSLEGIVFEHHLANLSRLSFLSISSTILMEGDETGLDPSI